MLWKYYYYTLGRITPGQLHLPRRESEQDFVVDNVDIDVDNVDIDVTNVNDVTNDAIRKQHDMSLHWSGTVCTSYKGENQCWCNENIFKNKFEAKLNLNNPWVNISKLWQCF